METLQGASRRGSCNSMPSRGALSIAGAAAALMLCGGLLSAAAPAGAPAGAKRHHHRRPPPPPPPPPPPKAAVCPDGAALTAAEADGLARGAAAALASDGVTVAVVDRPGNVLALWRKPAADPVNDDLAVGLARTGAFFSSDQVPLSSRTVRFVSGIHFPPGIAGTPSAALYGIENTNRGCDLNAAFHPGKAVPPARSVAGGSCNGTSPAGCGTGPVTGKADLLDSDPRAVDPGGLPLYRGSAVVGGIGVAGASGPEAEYAAVAAVAGVAAGFLPVLPAPGQVFLNGVRLPFVAQTTPPAGSGPGTPCAGPGLGCGAYRIPPQNGACVPEGYLVGPAGSAELAAAEVDAIVQQAAAAAARTRSALRLPIGARTRMVVAVAGLDGTLLALFRMPDAPVFSLDVAAAKARNVVYFSSGSAAAQLDLPGVPAGTAVSNRTIGFGAQPLFPSGIDGTGAGPFFDLFRRDAETPCSQGFDPGRPQNRNGVVFFPGSLPLYRGTALVGGLGVSGDGVEQDDYVSFLGAQGFLPPEALWADRVFVGGVRLPFLKFPRNPEG
jgi:uncharacterized protein GlcG (DUF336 family)